MTNMHFTGNNLIVMNEKYQRRLTLSSGYYQSECNDGNFILSVPTINVE